ncbi:putative elongator complex protein 1 [Phymastichus coffea]|uniref:putative elongator complex protein 1 n=1 Tax=Phymastichus coffea TaxID=108790 RepID=UPI00273CC7F4|nr:putative elongator complex protein 1 [Phymastichus coffea]
MKNIIVETQKINIFKDCDVLEPEGYHYCYNGDNDKYYCIGGEDDYFMSVNVLNNKKTIYKKVFIKQEKLTKAVGIEYCSVTKEFFVAYENGVVICMTLREDNKVKCDNIAEFNDGLYSIKLSPDHDIVVLLTKANVAITLSSNFDIFNETNLNSSNFGKNQFITVGWGKKETQFHGSEGKASAKAKPKLVGKNDEDVGLPKITWKGDGSLFAISYIDQETNARRFKVLDREGVLLYTSELVDCLEGTLSWKPSGNFIASTRKLPNKHTVALFEKNGLLHREFTLPFTTKNILIIDLIWSRDSDILGVWYKDLDTNLMTVQLWTEKNYHWYLKQTIIHTKANPILYVSWFPQANRDLMILSTKNNTVYTLYWVISCSRGKQISDNAVVSVIDGNKVLVTNFRDAVIPPPIAQQTMQFNRPVNAISFAPSNSEDSKISSNDFLALLSGNKIALCKHINESWDRQYAHQKTYNIDIPLLNGNKYSKHLIQHLHWYNSKLVLCSITLGLKSSLCELHLFDIEALDEILIDAKIIHEMPGQIEHIIPSSDSKIAYIVVEGKIYSYNDRDGVQKSDMLISNEGSIRAVIKVEFVKFNEKEVLVALTRKHILHVDGNPVANNVTSFSVHSEFLLITTLQHTLLCFKLNEIGLSQLCTKDLTIQHWNDVTNEIQRTQELNVRRVERGSILITSVPKGTKTIIQMPRGNIECIEPRSLSLVIIADFIDKLDYFGAFDLMRKQRIDLNLLYDHNPQSFVANVEKFVTDISNSNWMSLFLSELKEEDVTRTIYASSYDNRKANEKLKNIEEICAVLREIMERDSDNFLQPILISLVKSKKTIGLENALRRVKQLRSKHETCSGGSPEEALKYLLYMVDVSVLYDVALGMYDFELVMLVAQKSQRDPKEYVAQLNELRQLEPNYMKFSIDSQLKRYSSALEHIVKIPDREDECLAFIKSHELYGKALRLFDCKSKQYKNVANAYGHHLNSKAKHKEAGIMFVKAQNFEGALEAFRLAVSWQDAIVTAVKMNLNFIRLNELYEDLVTRLLEEKRYDEAALILSKRLNRFEDAVATLCQGRLWHQAWADAYCMKREDLIETHVKPGILDHADFTLTQLRQHREDFKKHKSRLTVLRAQAAARELSMHFEFDDNDQSNTARDISDLISDTTSIAGSTVTRSSQASHTTGRTYKSSKNRRKHERKMQSIKEGSVYEDLALIRILHQLISQAYKQKDEVRSLLEMLLYINSDCVAEELYKEMNEFLDEIRRGKQEIWFPAEIRSPESDQRNSSSNTSRIVNSLSATLIESYLLHPPEENPSNWNLDIFSMS